MASRTKRKVTARKPVVIKKDPTETTLEEHIKNGTDLVGFFGADFCDQGFQNLNSGYRDGGYGTLEQALANLSEDECSAIVEIRVVAVRPQVTGFIRMTDIPEKSSVKVG